jgi:hypothetical protein
MGRKLDGSRRLHAPAMLRPVSQVPLKVDEAAWGEF